MCIAPGPGRIALADLTEAAAAASIVLIIESFFIVCF
jgi:hypothetical protein